MHRGGERTAVCLLRVRADERSPTGLWVRIILTPKLPKPKQPNLTVTTSEQVCLAIDTWLRAFASGWPGVIDEDEQQHG
jgi:hypothetical protein